MFFQLALLLIGKRTGLVCESSVTIGVLQMPCQVELMLNVSTKLSHGQAHSEFMIICSIIIAWFSIGCVHNDHDCLHEVTKRRFVFLCPSSAQLLSMVCITQDS